ncbi:hypothetical protein K3495_g4553 [Podosphaera aphanis]|nr:hypothetical protein K3495_g4553 [Podosphaera aphanis]
MMDQHLAYKAQRPRSATLDAPSSPPLPTIFTFSTSPVYTLGRRDSLASMPKATIDSLIEPMPGIVGDRIRPTKPHRALIFETQRGGRTTFHGPGQLLIWPIMDIKSPWPACGPLDVRRYVHLLEESTILTLRHFGCESQRTRHPGIWEPQGNKKIAALGVNLRRNISSYGVGCNLTTDLRFFDRIVACGLQGKGTTSVRELHQIDLDLGEFAAVWVRNMIGLLYGKATTTTTSAPQPASELPRIIPGSVRKLGARPELLRRLWYLHASKKVIQSAQRIKKIAPQIPDFTTEGSESESDDTHPSQATSVASSTAKKHIRMEDLIAILDQNEKSARYSYRKCAGISYWTPPIGSAGSGSVIRRVPVLSDRKHEK